MDGSSSQNFLDGRFISPSWDRRFFFFFFSEQPFVEVLPLLQLSATSVSFRNLGCIVGSTRANISWGPTIRCREGTKTCFFFDLLSLFNKQEKSLLPKRCCCWEHFDFLNLGTYLLLPFQNSWGARFVAQTFDPTKTL